jgi:hypothetical protein
MAAPPGHAFEEKMATDKFFRLQAQREATNATVYCLSTARVFPVCCSCKLISILGETLTIVGVVDHGSTTSGTLLNGFLSSLK